MSSPSPNRTALLAPVFAAAALLLLGCGRGEQRGPAVEREESRGANHYRLRSHVEPHRVTLGDRAVWRLSADLPPSAIPGAPLRDPADSLLDLSVLDPAKGFRREGGVGWKYRLEARGFTLGPIPLPALRLPVRVGAVDDTLLFPPDTLFVDSLTQAMSGSVQSDRGPLPTELRPIDIIVAVVAVLLSIAVLAAIVVLIRNAIRRRRQPVAADPTAPPEPPEAILLRELDQLREEASTLPRDRFYERLSLALRGYAAAVTGIPVLDLTTTELTRELGRDSRVDPKGADSLLRALRRSDLAKFARREDPIAEAREALEEAATLSGRLLRPPPEHAEGPPGGTPGASGGTPGVTPGASGPTPSSAGGQTPGAARGS